MRLGSATTTDDAEGEPLAQVAGGHLTEEQVRRARQGSSATIEQRPSAVSAIKVDGRRAYARVRAGEQVDLPPRPVTVHGLTVHEIRRGDDVLDVDVEMRCSSGTYVRALARDLGEALGVGGHLTRLRRTSVGPFGLEEAHPLEDLAEAFALVDIAEVARRCFPTYQLDTEQSRDVGYGRSIGASLGADGPVALFGEAGGFLALYEQRGEVAAPVAVFA